MNNGITELVFILDKSGSMAGLERDTIGGFNAMIERQRSVDGKVLVNTLLFSNFSTVLHDREPLDKIAPLTEKDYQVGGGTALLDAIGGAIKHIGNIHKYLREEDVPMRTMFVITTDGMENASMKYTHAQIKQMINEKEECGWEFLFLASNIDACETAESIGIKRERAVNYSVKEETEEMYEVLGDVVNCYASCASPKEYVRFVEEMEKQIKAKKNNKRKK